LIRFLPWDAGLDAWGTALTTLGFITAFCGVAIGITQANPKTVLAYSTVSQMGLVVAVLGIGLAAGDPAAARGAVTAGTFYAAHHLLAKGALFLAVGVMAATGGRRLWPVLIPAAIVALGFAGLPLTGGALAKLAVKPVFGYGALGLLATLSAIGSTLLMFHFLQRIAAGTAEQLDAGAPMGLIWPWWLMFVAAIAVPWALAPAGGLGPWSVAPGDALGSAEIWSGLWPILIGAVLALGLRRWGKWLPEVSEGDLIVAFGGIPNKASALGGVLERTDTALRQWPVAGLSLLALAIVLWGAMLAGAGPP
jgi:formate hydrogenlyase subunit 3/multisubunit Na+/H+ antiporter MnhD subunit